MRNRQGALEPLARRFRKHLVDEGMKLVAQAVEQQAANSARAEQDAGIASATYSSYHAGWLVLVLVKFTTVLTGIHGDAFTCAYVTTLTASRDMIVCRSITWLCGHVQSITCTHVLFTLQLWSKLLQSFSIHIDGAAHLVKPHMLAEMMSSCV